MKRILVLIGIIVVANLIALEPQFMEDPAVSPDGKYVCFSYMSDLWLVNFDGDIARRLTVSKGSDRNPIYSPDGQYIYFETNRDGWRCIYKIPSDGGIATAVSKEGFNLEAVFPDDSGLLVRYNLPGRRSSLLKLNHDGSYKEITGWTGTFCSISNNNEKIIFNKRGYPYREAYNGSVNGDLWEYNIQTEQFNRLTETKLTERYPVYSQTKANTIYFAASDGEIFQLYQVTNKNFAKRTQLTNFTQWSVRDISIARQNDNMVFERFNQIWKYDAAQNKFSKLKITIKQDFINDIKVKESVVNEFENYVVSPDGKFVVFSYKYNLFAVPAEGGEVKQITHHQNGIKDILIMDDNQTIFFTSYIDGALNIYAVDIKDIEKLHLLEWSEERFITGIQKSQNRLIIHFNLDKKYNNLAIGDSLGQNIRIITKDEHVSGSVAMDNKSRYIFYHTIQPGVWTRKLLVYDMENEDKETILYTEDWMHDIWLGKDHKTAFVNKNSNIYKIDLQAKEDFFYKKDYWHEIINPKATEEKKIAADSLEIDFENIEKRVTPVITKPGYNFNVTVVSDSMFYYFNRFDDKYRLYKVKYNGENDTKIYTFPTKIKNIRYNTEQAKFYYLSHNTLKQLDPKTKKIQIIENKFDYEFNKLQLNNKVFKRVWSKFGEYFYDSELIEKKWDKLYSKYSKYISAAYSPDILAAIVEEMIGELNASHTGFYPRKDKSIKYIAKAYGGFELDFSNYPQNGVKIKKIYRNSKLNKPYKIKEGDIILSVDEKPIGKGKPVHTHFFDKVDKEIDLAIQTQDSIKTITIKGLSYWNHYKLYYDNWISEKRSLVNELSAGEYGYIHIQSMNNSSYENFKNELFTKNYHKKALILDVRDNGGGYTHDRILEILTKKTYGYSSSRYFNAKKYKEPARVWEKPIVLLINKNSFSDAEIFPHIFRELNLGKIIGTPTSGSVIGTGYIGFMEGSGMRMPGHGWFTKEKKDMEGNGAQPDIYIEPSPKDVIQENDIQLKKAIDYLNSL